jgi:splicing factor 3B subunit 3
MESSASGDGSSAADAATATAAAAPSSSSGPSTSAPAFSAGGVAGPSATHYLAKRVLHGSAVQHVARGRFRSEHLWEIVLCKVRSDPAPPR